MHARFLPLGRRFATDGILATDIDAEAFATARAYAETCRGADGLSAVYALLCPAVVALPPEAAAERELNFTGPPGDGAEPDDAPAECTGGAADFHGYGYRHLGPIVAGHAGWVRHHAGRMAGVIAGVMRDGDLPMRALALLWPEKADIAPLRLSRRACLVAAIASANDADGLRNFLLRARARPLSEAEALAELGLDAEAPSLPLTPERFPLFQQRIAESPRLAAGVEAFCAARRAEILAHLRRANALSGPSLALLDVGYAGNVQRCLRRIFEIEGVGTRLEGYYLLATPGALHAAGQDSRVMGYLARFGAPVHLSRAVVEARALLELLCMAPEGPLLGYAPGGEPRVAPPIMPHWQREQMAAVRQGALDFVADWAEGRPTLDDETVAAMRRRARRAILRMVEAPGPWEAQALGAWIYEDSMSLANSRTLAELWPALRRITEA